MVRMGTNYYARKVLCTHCGNSEELHIGKSSFGWKFLFQYNGGSYYKDVDSFKTWLSTRLISDEYGKSVTHDEFWEMVDTKQASNNHEDVMVLDDYNFVDREFS